MKVTVITVCLNVRDTIRDALESLVAQDYPHIEYVVVDGASTDGTLEIIREYAPHIDTLVSEPDRGLYDSANKGLRRATGDVVGFLHADDVFAHRGAVSRIAEEFQRTNAECVYGDVDFFDPNDMSKITRRFRSGDYRKGSFSAGWHPAHTTFYVKRELLLKIGGFDEGYRIASDVDLMMKVMEVHHARTSWIPEVLVHMRAGGMSNRNLKSVIRANYECYLALKANGLPAPWWFMVGKPLRKVKQLIG